MMNQPCPMIQDLLPLYVDQICSCLLYTSYAAQSKGGMGKKGITTREEDYVVDVFTASTHDYILFFTDTGKVYRKKGYQIPESGKTAKGTNIVNILQVEPGERIQAMIHTSSIEDDGRFLFMVTRNGTVKRLPANALKNLRNNGIRALRMDEGDELIAVRETDGAKKILIATHDGMAVCFDENDVRPMGREAVGVRGIKLREGDYVVGAARATAGKTVLTITENGYGKRTPVEEYRITNRGGLEMCIRDRSSALGAAGFAAGAAGFSSAGFFTTGLTMGAGSATGASSRTSIYRATAKDQKYTI